MIIFARQIPSSYLLQVKTTTNHARNHTSLFFVLIQRYYVLALLCLDAKILHSCGYGLLWKVCMEKKCSTIMPNLLCLLLQFLYSIMFLATSQGATVCHETKGTRDGRFTIQFFKSIYLITTSFIWYQKHVQKVCPAITTVYSKATLNMANSGWCCNKRCLDNGLQLLGWFCYSHSFTNWFSMILIAWKQEVPQPHTSRVTQHNQTATTLTITYLFVASL